ncbi:MAG TPA: AAA family ATPase [Candidatus Limnocylindrales bacterium]
MRPFRHGMVVGKFFPPHAGHEYLIRAAADACERVTVVVAPNPSESIPLEPRLAWLREMLADLPRVDFVGRYDDIPIDYRDPRIWDAHCALFREAVGPQPVDAVVTSEDYGPELARRFDAVHIAVDLGRKAFPVSGTAVRRDPVGHWGFLAPPVRAWFTRRVVVVGAESTGTTTMASALAEHYRARGGVWARTRWVPEYGRELTAKKLTAMGEGATIFDVSWDHADFEEVAKAQNDAEDAAARDGSPLLFCDTDSRVTAVWEERYLGHATPPVLAAARTPDLYLLTDDRDVPFHDDGLRDGEHLRAWMTGRFREVLAASGVPTKELKGSHEQRLAVAVEACEALVLAMSD